MVADGLGPRRTLREQMRGAAGLFGAVTLALSAAACGGSAPVPAATLVPVAQSTPTLAAPAVQAPTPPAADGLPPDEPLVLSSAAGSAPGAAAPVAAPVQVPAPAPVFDSGLAADPHCDGSARLDPLPTPGSSQAQEFFRSLRAPLPPAPVYNPPGQKTVGLQAGHWLTDEVPPELGRLQGGAFGGGKQEWEVNLSVAQRTAALLRSSDIQVDVLPSTVPPHYRANVFVALHADGDPAGAARGFKITRPGFSSVPAIDDRLVELLNAAYAATTELPRDDDHISLRMRYYYAFNSRRYCHAVAPGVPQAIVEMAYLTSAPDRQLLIGDPDRLARGLAAGLRAFLASAP